MHSGKLRFAHHLAMSINKLIEELLKFFKRRIIVLMFQDYQKMKMMFLFNILVESLHLRIRFPLYPITVQELVQDT
jgi:hypothetical protein